MAKATRRAILNYYNTLPVPPTQEISEVLKYLKTNPSTVFPNDALDRYDPAAVEVYSDKERGLRYVLLDGKRLYFKKKWSKSRIRKTFNGFLREQEPSCPHCYENDTFKVDEGDAVLDIGAAEGNFALSVVEKASKIIPLRVIWNGLKP